MCADPLTSDVAVFERLVTSVHCNHSGMLAELESQTEKMTLLKTQREGQLRNFLQARKAERSS
eukprot:4617006-Amphidinium_carterae.2